MEDERFAIGLITTLSSMKCECSLEDKNNPIIMLILPYYKQLIHYVSRVMLGQETDHAINMDCEKHDDNN